MLPSGSVTAETPDEGSVFSPNWEMEGNLRVRYSQAHPPQHIKFLISESYSVSEFNIGSLLKLYPVFSLLSSRVTLIIILWAWFSAQYSLWMQKWVSPKANVAFPQCLKLTLSCLEPSLFSFQRLWWCQNIKIFIVICIPVISQAQWPYIFTSHTKYSELRAVSLWYHCTLGGKLCLIRDGTWEGDNRFSVFSSIDPSKMQWSHPPFYMVSDEYIFKR